jgi:hypothetical protein
MSIQARPCSRRRCSRTCGGGRRTGYAVPARRRRRRLAGDFAARAARLYTPGCVVRACALGVLSARKRVGLVDGGVGGVASASLRTLGVGVGGEPGRRRRSGWRMVAGLRPRRGQGFRGRRTARTQWAPRWVCTPRRATAEAAGIRPSWSTAAWRGLGTDSRGNRVTGLGDGCVVCVSARQYRVLCNKDRTRRVIAGDRQPFCGRSWCTLLRPRRLPLGCCVPLRLWGPGEARRTGVLGPGRWWGTSPTDGAAWLPVVPQPRNRESCASVCRRPSTHRRAGRIPSTATATTSSHGTGARPFHRPAQVWAEPNAVARLRLLAPCFGVARPRGSWSRTERRDYSVGGSHVPLDGGRVELSLPRRRMRAEEPRVQSSGSLAAGC